MQAEASRVMRTLLIFEHDLRFGPVHLRELSAFAPPRNTRTRNAHITSNLVQETIEVSSRMQPTQQIIVQEKPKQERRKKRKETQLQCLTLRQLQRDLLHVPDRLP